MERCDLLCNMISRREIQLNKKLQSINITRKNLGVKKNKEVDEEQNENLHIKHSENNKVVSETKKKRVYKYRVSAISFLVYSNFNNSNMVKIWVILLIYISLIRSYYSNY